MFRIRILILASLVLCSSASVFGASFSDVTSTTSYTASLDILMQNGAILDDGSGKFSWESLATRGFLSSLLLASRCQSCIVPSANQLTQYSKKSLPGIENTHPYYYCAQEVSVAWVLENKSSCSSGSGAGFCPTDSITRIESARAFLTYSSLMGTSTDIKKKAIELALMTPDSDDAYLMTRGELVDMAARLLSYNQCRATSPTISNSGMTLSVSGTSDSFSFSALWRSDTTSYRWSLGDGTLVTTNTPILTHTYTRPGTWTVSVFGNHPTAPSLAMMSVESTSLVDSDTDGVIDSLDICPLVYWSAENKWCPLVATQRYQSIVVWLLAGTQKETSSSVLSGLTRNSCVLTYQKSRWLVIGTPVCDTCPCQNKVSILSEVRSCDIIFPSILSPDASLIYSRGAFYQIP